MLIKFSEEHYMPQTITEATRLGNILELVFCSDPSIILSSRQLINHRSFSDHNSLIINLSYGLKELKEQKRLNHASTTIFNYDVTGGDEEDWVRMNLLLEEGNWEEEMDGKSVQEMTDTLLCHIENNVKEKFPDAKEDETNKENKQSNNQIPRNMRLMFKQKRSLTKGIMKTISAKRCLELRKKIDSIEMQLKASYTERRNKKEKEAIEEIKKRTPKPFMLTLRSSQKLLVELVPSLRRVVKLLLIRKKLQKYKTKSMKKYLPSQRKNQRLLTWRTSLKCPVWTTRWKTLLLHTWTNSPSILLLVPMVSQPYS